MSKKINKDYEEESEIIENFFVGRPNDIGRLIGISLLLSLCLYLFSFILYKILMIFVFCSKKKMLPTLSKSNILQNLTNQYQKTTFKKKI